MTITMQANLRRLKRDLTIRANQAWDRATANGWAAETYRNDMVFSLKSSLYRARYERIRATVDRIGDMIVNVDINAP